MSPLLAPTTVVFDLGGVLVDWDPRYLYRSLFAGDDEGMERFLAEVCTPEWNAEQDSGRTWADAVAQLTIRHPEHHELIEAYHLRWPEMIGGEIPGTADVVEDLQDAGVRLLALTNWSAETFDVALERFPVLGRFEGIVVSGQERIAKPDPRIFTLLCERYALDPRRTLFVDDVEANVEAAARIGLLTHSFTAAGALRRDLEARGLLPARAAGPGSHDSGR